MKKLPYKEGDVFAVPLRNGGFAIGVVARSPGQGKVLLGYFFRYAGDALPGPKSISELKAASAILAVKFGDLSLYKKEWPVIGAISNWDRRDWPMPSFMRRDELLKRAWKISYSDDDPSKEIACEPMPYTETKFERDGLLGAGAVEIALTKLADPVT